MTRRPMCPIARLVLSDVHYDSVIVCAVEGPLFPLRISAVSGNSPDPPDSTMRILCIGAGAMKRVGILRLRPWSAFADPLASLGRGRMRPPLHRLCLHIEKPRHSGSG